MTCSQKPCYGADALTSVPLLLLPWPQHPSWPPRVSQPARYLQASLQLRLGDSTDLASQTASPPRDYAHAPLDTASARPVRHWTGPSSSLNLRRTTKHLDVGCGTGGFTSRALEPLSCSAKKIVGVDVSPSMLEYARRHNSQGSIAYELLDIASPAEVSAFVTKNGQFQRVYSFLCFHLVPDQTAAFRNICDLMAADGECLVTACVTNPALDAWLDVHAMPQWKRWVSDPRVVLPSCIYFNYTGTLAQIEEETRKCVVDAGLKCIACEVIECTWLLRDVGHIF
ncbi:hypothetical protein MTO96_020256, partial [Rhipicephalus appendiculatus]